MSQTELPLDTNVEGGETTRLYAVFWVRSQDQKDGVKTVQMHAAGQPSAQKLMEFIAGSDYTGGIFCVGSYDPANLERYGSPVYTWQPLLTTEDGHKVLGTDLIGPGDDPIKIALIQPEY